MVNKAIFRKDECPSIIFPPFKFILNLLKKCVYSFFTGVDDEFIFCQQMVVEE